MAENINILDELEQLNAGTLINVARKNLYFLPDDYFDNLSGNINMQICLNSVLNKNPFSVPENYFENFAGVILDKIAVNSNALNLATQSLYNVPDGYFNNLSASILQKIKAQKNDVQEELEEIAPLLNKIPKTNVYSVPAAYFEKLVPQTEIKAQPAKVISMGSKARKWFAYAAAACIAALMFGGGYYYWNESKTPNNHPSAVTRQYANINVEQAISKLSDDEIDNYLKNDNTDISIPQNDTQDVNIKTLLDNMSDEEISNYLLENSGPDENTKGS